MSIGYQEVQVSAETLVELKGAMDSAEGMKKNGSFKAWLYYSNLYRWQKQGHHFHYLTDFDQKSRKLLCTCGLSLKGEIEEKFTIPDSIAFKLSEFLLDRVQTAKGHRGLENFRSPICSLIIDYKWERSIWDYLWTAYCQECGAIVAEVRNEVAKKFVKAHNSECLVSRE